MKTLTRLLLAGGLVLGLLAWAPSAASAGDFTKHFYGAKGPRLKERPNPRYPYWLYLPQMGANSDSWHADIWHRGITKNSDWPVRWNYSFGRVIKLHRTVPVRGNYKIEFTNTWNTGGRWDCSMHRYNVCKWIPRGTMVHKFIYNFAIRYKAGALRVTKPHR